MRETAIAVQAATPWRLNGMKIPHLNRYHVGTHAVYSVKTELAVQQVATHFMHEDKDLMERMINMIMFTCQMSKQSIRLGNFWSCSW